ncbi:hypothetical protein XENORESO_017783 [Xenotaenia resolanae]|uniref:Uncharacterized protein n=1 Tax=Xenotaenia resolanae TaxID=208358 RepID=A0ABV0W5R0_9TELE
MFICFCLGSYEHVCPADCKNGTQLYINITSDELMCVFIFSAGLVILEIPTQPMVERSDVTLPCIHKETELIAKLKTELNHIRYFNKNGLHLTTCYFSNMTPKCHQG